MAETCTVAADDVRAVVFVFSQAKVLHTWLSALQSFDAGFDAAARMAAALIDAPEQGALPPSPVDAFEQMAIIDRHTLDAYLDQDFDRSEAFEVLRMMIAMRCNLTLNAAVSRG